MRIALIVLERTSATQNAAITKIAKPRRTHLNQGSLRGNDGGDGFGKSMSHG